MTTDDARAVLADYRTARDAMPEAVRILHDHGITQAEIIAISGLSREGVRKILARERVRSVERP